MERAASSSRKTRYGSSSIRASASERQSVIRPSRKVRWRFKARPFWTSVLWGLMLFVAGRIVVIPFAEGVCRYYSKTQELVRLQQHSQVLKKQLIALKKIRNYMETDAYVEQKGHQLGMIKENESQMVVVDPNALKLKEEQAKKAKQEVYKD